MDRVKLENTDNHPLMNGRVPVDAIHRVKMETSITFPLTRSGAVCDICEKVGFAGEVCPHREAMVPPWHSSERRKMIKAVMCQYDPELYRREQHGRSLSDRRCVFFQRDIVALSARAPLNITTPISEVFIAIDPTGGGDASNLAAVALLIDYQFHYVVRLFVYLFFFFYSAR